MSEFVLLERNESYALTVDVRTGFLPQSITLELVAIPGTACELGRERGGRGGEGRKERERERERWRWRKRGG